MSSAWRQTRGPEGPSRHLNSRAHSKQYTVVVPGGANTSSANPAGRMDAPKIPAAEDSSKTGPSTMTRTGPSTGTTVSHSSTSTTIDPPCSRRRIAATRPPETIDKVPVPSHSMSAASPATRPLTLATPRCRATSGCGAATTTSLATCRRYGTLCAPDHPASSSDIPRSQKIRQATPSA